MSRIKKNTISEKIVNDVKVTKLKAKKPRKPQRMRKPNIQCPNCMSTLKIGESGAWECTGDKLEVWVPYFREYQSLSSEAKDEFLDKISDKDMFNELYCKWEYLDESGRRVNFVCGYSPKMYPAVTRLRTSVPDPTTVASLERKLGRELTEQELKGSKPIWDGEKLVNVPMITLPDEV